MPAVRGDIEFRGVSFAYPGHAPALKRLDLRIASGETVAITVRDNIAYGRPEPIQEEIEAAARAARAHDFILRLPQGYGTRIGDRRVRLSGGQQQRLALARALCF